MVRARHWTPRTDGFERMGRELLLDDSPAVLHALSCSECGLQQQALLALALVGWTYSDYVQAVASRVA